MPAAYTGLARIVPDPNPQADTMSSATPASLLRSIGRAYQPRGRARGARACPLKSRPFREPADKLWSVTELTEREVAERVPSLTDEKLNVLSRREPVSVAPGTSLAECLRAIQRSGVGDSVTVVDSTGRLAGVLTERDIFGRLIGTDADLSQPVETVMNTSPHTLRLESTVHEAMELMQTGRYRNVPIIDEDGVLAGIVREQDILKYLAEAFPEELLNLPPRPHQRMTESEGA